MISPPHSPSKNSVCRPGTANAMVHTKRASHGRGWPCRRSSSACVRSFCVGPMRAEWMPGKPFSTSTSTPESSPTAGRPSATLAASALSWAFSPKVSPTSALPGSTAIRRRPVPARSSRYSPCLPALPVAMTSRRSAKRGYGSLLPDDQLFDALARQCQHRVELRTIVGRAFRRRLELDHASVFDHYAVEVGRGLEVLRVVEVKHRRAPDDPAADRGQVLPDRDLGDHPRVLHALDRHIEGAERARDRGRARAAVRLQHVAVERDRPLSDLAHVDGGPQRATDQPLDLVRATAQAALDRLPRAAIVSGARQHRILGGDPTLAAAAPVRRHAVLDAGRDPHARPPHLDQARALGVHVDAELDLQRAQLIGHAPVRSRCSRHRFMSLRMRAVPSKNMYNGTNITSGVNGSTPGVRKLASRPNAKNHHTRFLYNHRELMTRSMPSTNSTTGSSNTMPNPMTMIRTKPISSPMSAK